MTRTEYFAKQRELSRAILRAEQEAARRIRAATRELVLPLVKQYAEQGMITYPTEELARQIDHIIREEAAKPVAAARKLQDDMEASIAEKLGVNLRHRQEPLENARQRRLENAKEPIGTIIKTLGRGWGYGTSGLAAYHRDPQTGKIVWDDLPLEYQFRKRADLSEQVWKAVEEQEQMVFDVIRGGRAAGRNVKEVCGDLETFISYHDGGDRVVGRWGKMFPNTEEGRREAWRREYLTAHGGLQPGSDAAKALLRQPDAQAWVKQKMDETTKRGTPRLPSAVRSYATRLGKAGLDHRAIRIARTEMGNFLSDEQKEIARNSDICSGLVDWVMERGRDSWSCRCEELAKGGPYEVDNMVDKDGNPIDCPLHPNCCCELRPRLKTDEEILAALREEMKEDLETIEGTQEQKDLLARIDEGVIPSPSVYITKSNPVLNFPDGLGGNYTDDTPPKYIERSPDYSGITYTEAVKKEYEYLQKMTEKSSYKKEYMSIMSDNKEIRGTWEGGKTINSDRAMEGILENSADNSLSLLHTHLNEHSFSDIDLTTLCKYKSVKDISAKCPSGKGYYVTIGTGARPSEKEIKEKILEESITLLTKPDYNDIIKDDIRWKKFFIERNEIIKNLYGWILE